MDFTIRVSDRWTDNRTKVINSEHLGWLLNMWDIKYRSYELTVLQIALEDGDMYSVDAIAFNLGIKVEKVDLLDMSEFESELLDSDFPKILALF